MASQEQDFVYQQHPYVIVGAGISGLQAGIILAQHNLDFVILEASDKIGGRIGTEKLVDVMKKEFGREDDYPKWINSNKKVLNTPIEYGATWISQEHTFMLRILKEFKIRVFPQYYDGLSIYGKEAGKYQEVRTLNEHYQANQIEIQGLLDKIETIKNEFKQINQQIGLKKTTSERLNKFIDTYDTLSVKDFIQGQLKNEQLANELLNEIETLECISGDKLSMMQLFEDDSSLELLKYYTGKSQNTIDGMRVQNGMITIPESMQKKMMTELKNHKPNIKEKQVLIMNSPVIKIENGKDKSSKIYIKDSKKVYVCKNIFFSVPIAVINKIQITGISESKKIIFDNQESGSVNRVYLVFEHAFWRAQYSGYGSFSHAFPFNELTELSPGNLACGVLAFVFVGDKYKAWVQANPNPEKRLQYLKGIIADLFLKGDKNSPNLSNCFSYTRSYSDHPYIKAGYQATTKREIWKQLKDKGQDYSESYDRDENSIIYIGSQFADEFSTYMEGAIRHSRMKVFKSLGIPDPWRN